MKITKITESPPRGGKKPYWTIEFEGESKRLLVWAKAEYKEGDDIPIDLMTIVKKEGFPDGFRLKEDRQQKPRQFGKSPEEIQSIKEAVAIKAIARLMVADKATLPEAAMLHSWITKTLSGSVGATIVPTASAPPKVQPAKPLAVNSTATAVKDTAPLKNLGELFTKCKEIYGMTQSDVLKELGVSDKGDIGDVGEAWQTIQAVKGQK